MSSSKLSPHPYSEGEKRHFRIMSMINEEGQQVLKLVLIKILAGPTLAERLAEAAVKAQLDDALDRKQIQKDQYERFYPQSGAIQTDTFDVTLLVFLIRQLHPSMKMSNKLWINPPHENLRPEAGVTRLKVKRNKLAHSGRTALTENEFEVEFQELQMILCRLVRYASSLDLTIADVVQTLNNKKHALFEGKPESSHVATSTSSSLEKVPACISDTDSVFSLPSTENAGYCVPSIGLKKEATTSTSSLEKKRKLSFKVRSCIKPFVMSPKKDNEKENTPVPKRIKTKDKQKPSERKCKPCSCSLKGSCRNEEANAIMTNDHSSQQYRCNISGISKLASGALVVVDSSHDIVQALSPSGELIDEFECVNPHGVVALSCEQFAVTLRTLRKVLILKLDETMSCIELINEFELDCDFWLSDIRCSSGYLYILCENGDLHIMDSTSGSDAGRISTNIQFVSHFDITNKGDRVFLTHGSNISCIDGFGNTIWCYSDKTKKSFKSIAVHKDTIFVCAWEKHKVLAFAAKEGKCMKEYSDEQMRNPWSLCLRRRTLYVSQYMSELNSLSCREVVVMKI